MLCSHVNDIIPASWLSPGGISKYWDISPAFTLPLHMEGFDSYHFSLSTLSAACTPSRAVHDFSIAL